MNIFFLSDSPMRSAQYMIDKHVVKMRAESIQMIASTHKRYGIDLENDWPLNSLGQPYRGGYSNHPCTKWVGECVANYIWICNHLSALEFEYKIRFLKMTSHTSKILYFLYTLGNDLIESKLPKGDHISPPPLAMDSKYIIQNNDGTNNIVESYRNYYKLAKMYDKNNKSMCVYTNRSKPEWLQI